MIAPRKSRPPHGRGDEVSFQDSWEGAKADYNAAKNTRFRRRRQGIQPTGSNADWHYRSEGDFLRMMEIARDMARNDAIVGQMLDRAISQIIQNGFSLEPQTSSERVNKRLQQLWRDWANDERACDLAGERTFRKIEKTVLRSMIVDGDCFALPTKQGALELIEGHRCRTPTGTKRKVVHGVMMNQFRQRSEYWFTRDEISPHGAVQKVGQMRRIRAFGEEGHRNVYHVADAKRISQTRGITWFAPVVDLATNFEDINFAKTVQQQIVSCFAVLRERGADFRGSIQNQYGNQTTETLQDGVTRLLEGLGPGMEVAGAPGEKLQGFSPNVPNPEFFEHAKLILMLIAGNFAVPLVMLLMDARETNFSGFRGALDIARQQFTDIQNDLIDQLHSRVYPWKVRQWLAEDPELRRLVEMDGIDEAELMSHRFSTPRWKSIQPLHDAQANALRIQTHQVTGRRLAAELGYDYDEAMREEIADRTTYIAEAMRAASELNGQYPGQEVDWREIWHPTGMKPLSGSLSMQDEASGESSQAQGDAA